jgi:hypothetical protein
MESTWLMMILHGGINLIFLALYIVGLVVCINNRRLSTSMTLLIVAFVLELLAWLMHTGISLMYRYEDFSDKLFSVLGYVSVFASVVSLAAAGVLVGGLAAVFGDVRRRLDRSRDDRSYEDPGRRRRPPFDERREPGEPRYPGSPDIQR